MFAGEAEAGGSAVQEFVEFLGRQSPYDRLDADDLERLARTIEVEYFAADTWIVVEGGERLDHLWVVRTGSVGVLDRGRIVDVLEAGDTFGHISLLSGLRPPLAVRSIEDTICYQIPDPRKVLAHPELLQFSHYNTLVARERLIASGGATAQFDRDITVAMRPAEWCDPRETVRDVALRLTENHQSALLVEIDGTFGIVTDDDFRREVATGRVGIDQPISAIASIPAIAVPAGTTVWATYLDMVERGIQRMVVTDAGGRPIGVAGLMDMIGSDIHHPLVVRTAITRARTLDELAAATALIVPTLIDLHDADMSSRQLGAIHATIVESALRQLIELTTWQATLPAAHTWLLLGSHARREPLPGSDLDTAFAWRARPGDEANADTIRDGLAVVLGHLPSLGFEPCPHDANAYYPLFSRSMEAWGRAAKTWAEDPAESGYLLLASTILDCRPITNPELAGQLVSRLLARLRGDEFLRAMLRFALTEKPPAGFVRGFVVERFGERHGQLDLKRAGLRPIVSLARALALRAGDTSGTTLERLDRAALAGLLSPEEAETLKSVFLLCYDLLLDAAIDAARAGEPAAGLLAPGDLEPLRRRYLRDGFRAIERIQDRLAADRHLASA
jgi:CBS domain-containing protein